MAVFTIVMCSEERDISRQKHWTLTYQLMSHRYRDIPTFEKPVENQRSEVIQHSSQKPLNNPGTHKALKRRNRNQILPLQVLHLMLLGIWWGLFIQSTLPAEKEPLESVKRSAQWQYSKRARL